MRKIKYSISSKIFAATFVVWLVFSILQMLILNVYFENIYTAQVLKKHQEELQSAVALYNPGNENGSSRSLRDYTNDHHSPVFVLTDTFEVADGELFKNLGLITVRMEDNSIIRIPLAYIYELSHQPYLASTFDVSFMAIPVGDSKIYEPLTMEVNNQAYNNRESIRKYRLGERKDDVYVIEENGIIESVSNIWPDGNMKYHYAKLLYDEIKDCLIYRMNPKDYLEKAKKEVVTDSLGNTYHLLAESRKFDQKTYYFVTIRQIMLTGNEMEYAEPVFYLIFLFTGILFILFTYLLSKYISRPVVKISSVTKQISELNFAQKVPQKGKDELAELAGSINMMSDNLQNALEELHKSSKAAQDNEERMRKLLTNLAHEFKTPLSIITFYLDAADNGLLKGDSGEWYCTIEKEIKRLTDLVDETIDLTNLQSGNWKIDIGIWNLQDVIESALMPFSQQLKAGGYTFVHEYVNIHVYADSKRIVQVLVNYLSNAIKYVDCRKLIKIGIKMIDSDTVSVYVANSGSLSDEDMEKIWLRYYRVSDIKEARLPSEGIGLDIVKSILEAHDSVYGVTQKEGMIYFYFELKVFRDE